jgi:hypothetical protein
MLKVRNLASINPQDRAEGQRTSKRVETVSTVVRVLFMATSLLAADLDVNDEPRVRYAVRFK